MNSGAFPPIIFLHVPKTAGQAVHHGLVQLAGGAEHVSPVRTHTQAPETPEAQMPPGFRVYSGHLDWTSLDHLPAPRFVFTVLRDPRERIASFYFYLRAEALRLAEADETESLGPGPRRILDWSADDYFTKGDPGWQMFIRDHYDNFYTSYFATRRMRGLSLIDKLPDAEVEMRALQALRGLDAVYATSDLMRLEQDLADRYGQRVTFADRFVNSGPYMRDEPRWPKLLERLERPASRALLESFAQRDDALIARFGLDLSARRPSLRMMLRLTARRLQAIARR